MSLLNEIKEASIAAVTYPDLVKKYIAIGIESYTVDVATGLIIYRKASGEIAVHQVSSDPRTVATDFNKEAVVTAIRTNQAGNSDFTGFIQSIADAGVRFYEATLTGDNKRVTYIGIGDSYEERIPL